MNYQKGHRFRVPNDSALRAAGCERSVTGSYRHPSMPGAFITEMKVDLYGGQVLTLKNELTNHQGPGWWSTEGGIAPSFHIAFCEFVCAEAQRQYSAAHAAAVAAMQQRLSNQGGSMKPCKGYQFRVPTEADLRAAGCQRNAAGYYTLSFVPYGYLTDGVLLSCGGRTLTVKRVGSAGWCEVEETNKWLFHVEFCEQVAGIYRTSVYPKVQSTSQACESSSKPNHTCTPGMTPVDGWTICKHCGKNLKKFGML